jgi:DNA-binding LacI/PurR family transcriptional regulator
MNLFSRSRKPRLHEQIVVRLRDEILKMSQAGDLLEAEKVYAGRFGVSLVTLRNATQVLEQEGILERVSGVGLVVRKLSRPLALVISEVVARPRPLVFHLQFAILLQRELRRRGLCSRMTSWGDGDTDGCDDLKSAIELGSIGGVVGLAGGVPKEVAALAEQKGVPVWGTDDSPLMVVDYVGMVRVGVEYLAAEGCRNLAALLSGPPDGGGSGTFREVFQEALESRGLKYEKAWVSDHNEARLAGSGWQGFRDVWAGGGVRPDGLLVLDDVLFRDAARAILELGIRVPEELKIITHANRQDEFLSLFPVARLEVDPARLADLTASKIQSHLRGETPAPAPAMFQFHPPGVAGIPGDFHHKGMIP